MIEEDDIEDNNIQWKSKKNSDHIKSGRKDKTLSETNSLGAKKKPSLSVLKKNDSKINQDFNKIRKKIRDIFDEEDDEDDFVYKKDKSLEMLEEQQSSLINALSQKEKQNLNTHQTLENASQINNAVLKLGLKNISKKVINKNAQNNIIGKDVSKQMLQDELSIKTKIKVNKLNSKEAEQAIKAVEKIGKKLAKNLDAKQLAEVGKNEKSDQKVAEIILKKTGRKENSGSKRKAKNKIKAKALTKTFAR